MRGDSYYGNYEHVFHGFATEEKMIAHKERVYREWASQHPNNEIGILNGLLENAKMLVEVLEDNKSSITKNYQDGYYWMPKGKDFLYMKKDMLWYALTRSNQKWKLTEGMWYLIMLEGPISFDEAQEKFPDMPKERKVDE